MAPTGVDVIVAGFDSGLTMIDKSDAKDELTSTLRPCLFDLHELMMANEEHAILLVLQGLDCSGKNGTIKHVVSAMNPAGVRTASFTEPEGDERAEHFLERIRREAPQPGELVVFDRSHYEDVFVPAVHDGMDGDEFDARIDEIVEFENELVDNGVTIVKCFLHISYDEQRERLLRRLRRRDKRWKFSEADLDTRGRWPEWEVVYGKAIGRRQALRPTRRRGPVPAAARRRRHDLVLPTFVAARQDGDRRRQCLSGRLGELQPPVDVTRRRSQLGRVRRRDRRCAR